MRKTLVKLGDKELKGEYLFDGTMLFATRRLDGTVINVKDPAVSLFMDFLKVSKSRKQFLELSIFPKKPRKPSKNYFKSSQDIFFLHFVRFLKELRKRKIASEIIWPLSNVKTMRQITPNFCGLLRKAELYPTSQCPFLEIFVQHPLILAILLHKVISSLKLEDLLKVR